MKTTPSEYLSKIGDTIKGIFTHKETTSKEIKETFFSDDKKAKITLGIDDWRAIVLHRLSTYTGLSKDIAKKIFVLAKKDSARMWTKQFDLKTDMPETIGKAIVKSIKSFRPEDHDAIAHLLIDRGVGGLIIYDIHTFVIRDYKKLFDHMCKRWITRWPIYAWRASKEWGKYLDEDYMKQKIIKERPMLAGIIYKS